MVNIDCKSRKKILQKSLGCFEIRINMIQLDAFRCVCMYVSFSRVLHIFNAQINVCNAYNDALTILFPYFDGYKPIARADCIAFLIMDYLPKVK